MAMIGAPGLVLPIMVASGQVLTYLTDGSHNPTEARKGSKEKQPAQPLSFSVAICTTPTTTIEPSENSWAHVFILP